MGGAHGWRSGKSRWEPVPGGPFDVGAQLRVAATVSASGDNPHVATRPAAARLTYRRARAPSSRPTVVRPADVDLVPGGHAILIVRWFARTRPQSNSSPR